MSNKDITRKPPQSLAIAIRKNIGLRILISCIFLFATLISTFFYSYKTLTSQIVRNVKYIESDLTPYIISQKLIDNRYAIDIKISELEKKNNFIISLHENEKSNISGLEINNLFNWVYYVPITSQSHEDFGYYTISGSFLKSDFFIDTIYVDIILLLVFLFLVFFVLYPIGSYIPKKMIINPIVELLELIEKSEKEVKISFSDPAEIISLKRKILSLLDKERISLEKESYFKISRQVAHDIRSPLTALEISTKNLSTLPEKQRLLIRNATKQIKDISNNLLQDTNIDESNSSQTRTVMTIPIVEYVLSEKNAELSSRKVPIIIDTNISRDAYSSFTRVVPLELKRILSNLINNSIEAIPPEKKGKISVDLSCNESFVQIAVNDNGRGINNKFIHTIFSEGVSSKNFGTGLGLYHAKLNIEKWDGSIEISSEFGHGTTVKICLPKLPPSTWFLESLLLPRNSTLVVVDDSKSIHDLWQQSLNDQKVLNIKLINFDSPESFLSWYKKYPNKSGFIYLIDYEFSNSQLNGIDIINELNVRDQKVLITSYSEEYQLQHECINLNVRLLPKFFIPYIPICTTINGPKIIIIEPDKSLITSYMFRAKLKKTPVIFFKSISEFYSHFRIFGTNLTLYISDEYIEEINALKHFGYNEIFITTFDTDKYADFNLGKIIKKHGFLE